jgi:hypothetical protein
MRTGEEERGERERKERDIHTNFWFVCSFDAKS